MKLYRGLSLPKDALQFYEDRQKDQEWFAFNGFTSTSVDRKKASVFAFKYLTEGKVPVIFEIYARRDDTEGKKYLDTPDLSAFPDEKEVLIGYQSFHVIDSSSNFKKDEKGAVVIQLREYEY